MKVLFQTDHALYVLADPPEPSDVTGDEGEGDGVQGVLRRLGRRDRGQIHLHPHLQGKVQGQERGLRQGQGKVCKAGEGAGKGKLQVQVHGEVQLNMEVLDREQLELEVQGYWKNMRKRLLQ